MDLIPILLGSLPLAHNAQHSLVSAVVRMRIYAYNWASGSEPTKSYNWAALSIYIYPVRVPDTVNF